MNFSSDMSPDATPARPLRPSAVCSYLRGRLGAQRVEYAGGDQYRLTLKVQGQGHGHKDGTQGEGEGVVVVVWRLGAICEAYGIDPMRIEG